MKSQKKLIHETDWNTLIILDACRYDYFEEIYENYLEGDLQKVESAGLNTPSWLKETFTERHEDIVYVSSHPFINSKMEMKGFSAEKHFIKTIDVWKEGWNEETGTVHPNQISKETRKARMFHPKKRLIAHFLQPHFPYLDLPMTSNIFNVLEGARENYSAKITGKGKLFKTLGKFASKIISPVLVHKVGKLLGLNSETSEELVAKRYGTDSLRTAYKKNLEIVLDEIAKLSNRLPGRVVVSADHGEMLGEYGLYGHGSHHPFLKEVPWLEVEGVN